ncbi:TPA_asm: hypothetical protein GYO10_12710 [Listeria monocytogenes]|nr:hypothetical protein [Listeria monocytogenes]HAB8318809.1 hypothetical protein [Listeria monocytogenes]HAB8519230.1 hypothetical protein [Listeria monocytogenes]HAB8831971.1 hypothetical protein [Listeria monocytogenes]HAB9336089.1 hypothetical protein [Listeria monocytogenes]
MKLELIAMTVNELNMVRVGYDDTKIGSEYSDVEIVEIDLADEGEGYFELIFKTGAQIDDLLYYSASIQAKIVAHEIDNETFESEITENIDEAAMPLFSKASQLLTNLSAEVSPIPQIVLFSANYDDSQD